MRYKNIAVPECRVNNFVHDSESSSFNSDKAWGVLFQNGGLVLIGDPSTSVSVDSIVTDCCYGSREQSCSFGAFLIGLSAVARSEIREALGLSRKFLFSIRFVDSQGVGYAQNSFFKLQRHKSCEF